MNFHKADRLQTGFLHNRARRVNVFHLARETAPSYFTSQWKLLELKRHLDNNSRTLTSPALPFGL